MVISVWVITDQDAVASIRVVAHSRVFVIFTDSIDLGYPQAAAHIGLFARRHDQS